MAMVVVDLEMHSERYTLVSSVGIFGVISQSSTMLSIHLSRAALWLVDVWSKYECSRGGREAPLPRLAEDLPQGLMPGHLLSGTGEVQNTFHMYTTVDWHREVQTTPSTLI